jgi:hypothetical protein
MIRTYTELRRLETFEERYRYLALRGEVGRSTFGFDRYLNQRFYTSSEWRHIRQQIIVRDNGCDLGVDGYEIHERLIIHHMNPMTVNDLIKIPHIMTNPEFLITTTHRTHNAIHYGDESLLAKPFIERRPGDTQLW